MPGGAHAAGQLAAALEAALNALRRRQALAAELLEAGAAAAEREAAAAAALRRMQQCAHMLRHTLLREALACAMLTSQNHRCRHVVDLEPDVSSIPGAACTRPLPCRANMHQDMQYAHSGHVRLWQPPTCSFMGLTASRLQGPGCCSPGGRSGNAGGWQRRGGCAGRRAEAARRRGKPARCGTASAGA